MVLYSRYQQSMLIREWVLNVFAMVFFTRRAFKLYSERFSCRLFIEIETITGHSYKKTEQEIALRVIANRCVPYHSPLPTVST
jgi:hypothetical protein